MPDRKLILRLNLNSYTDMGVFNSVKIGGRSGLQKFGILAFHGVLKKVRNFSIIGGQTDLDPQSFERIKGILAEKINTEDFDSEEMVKQVRSC